VLLFAAFAPAFVCPIAAAGYGPDPFMGEAARILSGMALSETPAPNAWTPECGDARPRGILQTFPAAQRFPFAKRGAFVRHLFVT